MTEILQIYVSKLYVLNFQGKQDGELGHRNVGKSYVWTEIMQQIQHIEQNFWRKIIKRC